MQRVKKEEYLVFVGLWDYVANAHPRVHASFPSSYYMPSSTTSARMEMFSVPVIHHRSHQPYVATEHLKRSYNNGGAELVISFQYEQSHMTTV